MIRAVMETQLQRLKFSNTVNEAFKCLMTLPDMDTTSKGILNHSFTLWVLVRLFPICFKIKSTDSLKGYS